MKETNKKGQVSGIQSGFYALMFVAVALIVVVIINAFGADFVDSQQNNIGKSSCAARTDGFTNYNVTAKNCYNSTFSTTTVDSGAWNVTVSGLSSQAALAEGTDDVTDVGIITIVLGLLIALIGLFGWYGYNRLS